MNMFCVARSPYELQEWIDATRLSPDHTMIFEAWSRRRSLAEVLAKARSFGHDAILVTWEPWEPTPVGTPGVEQGAVQPAYSAHAILNGDWDEYIDMNARAFRDSGLSTVFLRWGHEMNGNWYPWSADPDGYVEAWKYLRYRMRSQRGAWNVKFVWSPNPDVWRSSPADWLARMLPYWPGPRAVDYLGFTVINFGADRDYSVEQFVQRFDLARRIFAKPMLAAELNVALDNAEGWLYDLADAINRGRLPLSCVALSQGPSRAEATQDTGNLSWNLMDETWLVDAIDQVMTALHNS